MKYEELIAQLCEVIKESENNAKLIYDNTEIINTIISDLEIPLYKKDKIGNAVSNIFGLFFKTAVIMSLASLMFVS